MFLKVAKKLTFINTVALEKVNLSSSLYLKSIFLILPIAIFQCLSSVLLLSYFIKLQKRHLRKEDRECHRKKILI